MKSMYIQGPAKLSSSVQISGAKNAALPLLAATLLVNGRSKLNNLPLVSDVRTMLALLQNLGAVVELDEANHSVLIDASNITHTKAVYDIVSKMRASILVLGPLLSRFEHASVSLPGGCAIGQRPIDLHLYAMQTLGANVELKDGYVYAQNKLKGARISFDKITVGGSENALLAAALANGTTTIINAATEPEVVNLCEFLQAFGCRIDGIGTKVLTINPPEAPATYVEIDIIADRIEAGTYMCAAAITNSEVTLKGINAAHLGCIIDKLASMNVQTVIDGDELTVLAHNGALKATNIQTAEYPGFPTDMQAQFMALATQARGVSSIDERLFENRFMHVSELNRMGAHIQLNAHTATLSGPSQLCAAEVMATDLRASSALVLAALAANGQTKIRRIYHLMRGYENLAEKLSALGAKITIGDDNENH